MSLRGLALNDPAFCSAPAIDGDTIVFVCDGAIWEVSATHGLARRRTGRLPSISTPLIDAERGILMCAAAERGPAQVCRVDRDGSVRQIAWMPEACHLLGWADDGQLVFTSSAGHAFRQVSTVWLLDVETGIVDPLGPFPASHFGAGAGGARVTGTPGVDPRTWRGYAGGARGEIWLATGGGPLRRVTPGDFNVHSPLLVGGRIFFVGDHGGAPNLWSCGVDGGTPRQHTFHPRLAVHSPSTDGRRIVYCVGGDLFLFDPVSGEAKLDVRLDDPAAGRRPYPESLVGGLVDADGSPAANAVACVAFGRLHECAADRRRVRSVALPGPCFHGRYLADGALLAVVRSADGDQLVLVGRDRQEALALGLTGSIGRVVGLAISASGTAAVLSNEQHQVLSVELGTGRTTLIDTSRHRPIEHVDVSPDGSICAYALPTGFYRSVVRVARSNGDGLLAETDPPLADIVPRFAADGRSVYFLSFDTRRGDQPDLITALHRLELDSRATVRIPTPPGSFADIVVLDGDVIVSARPGRTTSLRQRAQPFTLLSDDSVPPRVWGVHADRLGRFGRTGVLTTLGSLMRLALFETGGGIRNRRLDLTRGPVVDPVPLRQVALDEAWRLARDHVVAGEPNARAWRDVHACYSELVARACTSRDARAIINEMLGHLRSSHAIVRSPVQAEVPPYGLLGVSVRFDRDLGAWRIDRVPRVDPRAAEAIGLADPTLQVEVGDTIVELDGEPLDAGRHPYRALMGKADRSVRCTLKTERGPRTVQFVAVRYERPLQYGAWVLERERRVAALSNATVGYLHVPDVSERTRIVVERWLWCHEEIGGLVVDLRYNEGGAYGGEIGALLCRPPVARVKSRWSIPRALPLGAGDRRLAVITNRFTSSGGELLAEMLRAEGSARIIGEATLGAGIGHGVTRTLPDGSELLLPELSVIAPTAWTHIENRGVVPDVLVSWQTEFQDDVAVVEAVKAASDGVTRIS